MKSASNGSEGGRTFVLAFEPGEKVMEGLRRFAVEQNVRGAWLSGLGALRDAELGWLDTASRSYVTRKFPDTMELVSLAGNVGRAGGEAAVHAHAALAGRDLAVVGGHLVEAVCAVTVEMEVRETGFPLDRALDGRFGLKLLDFGSERGAGSP